MALAKIMPFTRKRVDDDSGHAIDCTSYCGNSRYGTAVETTRAAQAGATAHEGT